MFGRVVWFEFEQLCYCSRERQCALSNKGSEQDIKHLSLANVVCKNQIKLNRPDQLAKAHQEYDFVCGQIRSARIPLNRNTLRNWRHSPSKIHITFQVSHGLSIIDIAKLASRTSSNANKTHSGNGTLIVRWYHMITCDWLHNCHCNFSWASVGHNSVPQHQATRPGEP